MKKRIGHLTDNDWKEAEQAAHMKLWNDDWQEEEVSDPDPSLASVPADFVAEDGIGRTVLVLVRVIPHTGTTRTDA